MFTSSKPFDSIESAMPTADAADWFGKAPPDLSLIARERGDRLSVLVHEGVLRR